MYYLRVAFASEDGENLYRGHFGDSRYYFVYDISRDRFLFIEQIKNIIKENDSGHGDKKKAVKISELLAESEVLCGRAFGKNIKRIVKKFLPVVVNSESIDDAIKLIQKNYSKVVEEFKKGEKRKHLVLRE